MDDQAAIQRCRAENVDAFRDIVERYETQAMHGSFTPSPERWSDKGLVLFAGHFDRLLFESPDERPYFFDG